MLPIDLSASIAAGSTNPLILFAMALLLGALHGLEPGHSKTMIAAYIIAIRGSVLQALLLGVSAAGSHVVIVWILAILGLRYGDEFIGENLEPVLLSLSGAIITGIGLWVLWQALRGSQPAQPSHGLAGHDHDHHHRHDHDHDHDDRQPHIHSGNVIAPHEQSQAKGHAHMDAHAMAHAREIELRLKSGKTSTWQTILFGLSGGLIPCPAAITVLLLCLQLKQMTLGLTLVTAFSLGLAATLVMVGIAAAFSIRYAARRFTWLDTALSRAPFISAALIIFLGVYMIYSSGLPPHNHH